MLISALGSPEKQVMNPHLLELAFLVQMHWINVLNPPLVYYRIIEAMLWPEQLLRMEWMAWFGKKVRISRRYRKEIAWTVCSRSVTALLYYRSRWLLLLLFSRQGRKCWSYELSSDCSNLDHLAHGMMEMEQLGDGLGFFHI